MEQIPLISVIVPVYKVEKYLDDCVKSIINQTYKNLEIILVDDGSPDHCGAICDKWSTIDSRIKVIHKKNGGLSDARNAGLSEAHGDYISFVDSDDLINEGMLAVLMNSLLKTNSDIASCRFVQFYDDEIPNSRESSYETTLLTENNALKELIHGEISTVVWNKLYLRSVMDGILFEVGKCHEDEFWSYQVFGKAAQIVVVDYIGYYYRQHADSIMGEKYSSKRLDAIEAKVRRQSYLNENKKQLALAGKENLLFSCLYHGQLALQMNDKDEKKRILKKLNDVYKIQSKGKLPRSKLTHWIWLQMGRCSFRLTCRLRAFLKVGF